MYGLPGLDDAGEEDGCADVCASKLVVVVVSLVKSIDGLFFLHCERKEGNEERDSRCTE